ncbi:MAG: hypothetical protein KGQ70_06870, partial [Alphaproteobacteria bacterium]|nr:hypothetical protein [Alphaproteobacteria bacterium]
MKNLSIAGKNMVVLALLALPFLLTAYYLADARATDTDFAATEIAGINDIRPLQTVLQMLAADMPAKVDVAPAALAVKKTLAADPQQLGEPVRTQALLAALSGIGVSTAPMDAIGQTRAMISSLAGRAGLDRDPDPDASLLGGIISDRLPALLEQAKALTDALAAA